jgi:FdhD protein
VTSSSLPTQRVKAIALKRIDSRGVSADKDFLAGEEPLEIRVEGHSVAVVMRTPGEDSELAAGFLMTEGLIHAASDLIDIRHRPHCLQASGASDREHEQGNGALRGQKSPRAPSMKGSFAGNVIDVRLRRPKKLDLRRLTRHVFSSSSCGICSKASIETVLCQFPSVKGFCEVAAEVLLGLPQALLAAQETFRRTGGLHACALFDLTGKLLVLREDVGRHNALDKIVGRALLSAQLPLHQHILLLSGRASFEMMQKSLAAGIPIVAAISAPSSLAVEFAQDSGQTLIGFLRGDRMNIYSGHNRVRSRGDRSRIAGLKLVRLTDRAP